MTSKKLGIVGGGQLGKMLAIAANNMGIAPQFIDPSPDAVAKHVANHICASYEDPNALKNLFEQNDAVTFEFENVSLEALKKLNQLEKLSPNLEALYVSNDRIREKEFFQKCGLDVAPYRALIDTKELSEEAFLANVLQVGETLGYPIIVKTCSLGYDGKGQVSIADQASVNKALQLKNADRLIVEKRINFQREFSVLAARSRNGETVIYPSPSNVHKEGILYSSVVIEDNLSLDLKKNIEKVLKDLNYCGILAIEFFDVEGKFLVNEMAPRVHNSGHWTIEGAVTSQFENHVRAVLGLALGDPGLRFPIVMLNIVGTVPDIEKILKIPGAHLHLYGKEPRPGRKLGHVTIEAARKEQLLQRFDQAVTLIT